MCQWGVYYYQRAVLTVHFDFNRVLLQVIHRDHHAGEDSLVIEGCLAN